MTRTQVCCHLFTTELLGVKGGSGTGGEEEIKKKKNLKKLPKKEKYFKRFFKCFEEAFLSFSFNKL